MTMELTNYKEQATIIHPKEGKTMNYDEMVADFEKALWWTMGENYAGYTGCNAALQYADDEYNLNTGTSNQAGRAWYEALDNARENGWEA